MKDTNEKNITDKSRPPRGQEPRPAARRSSFVMTLWLEGAEDTAVPQWRWRIIDAQKNQQVYFTKLADVLAFVSEQAGVSPPC